MNLLQEAALTTYYYGTWPARLLTSRALAQRGRAPLVVLFYHRVADTPLNPWTISRRDFERQLRWLLARFECISLEKLQDRIRANFNERPAVSITFDDGYADNCDFAIPLLLDRQVPVTYFVSLGSVLTQSAFPHDLKAGVSLKPNSIEQLRQLASAGIEIGAHTRTHADLGTISDVEILFDEVVTARDELQDLVGHQVRYFAFPFGLPQNLNDQAIDLARGAGFAGVCSAYGDYNLPADDPFHIKRIHGDPELIRLKNWMTLDPRKLCKRSAWPAAQRKL